ncbi:hypothetical protein ABFX02_08G044400 [Erythranthe guttata]
METTKQQSVHIVLVHGACHGAWCWYKLRPLLEAAGHRVTAVDLAASGIDRRSLEEVRSLADYSQPLLELMASIRPHEKVVLVGHSLGGMNLGLAMDMYSDKISVAVFVALTGPLSFWTRNKSCNYCERVPVAEWLDTELLPYGDHLTSLLFGPEIISSKLYHLCSAEDVALAKMLLRPSSLFLEDLSKKSAFSKERFGSVERAYIVCTQDKTLPVNFQRWQIETNGVAIVKEIKNADHMAMLSTPQQLSQYLLEIANNFI